ncbi:MAG: antitoxin [Acidimicrobiales bacterium]
MPRTTIDIDASVLRELKRRQRREKTTLGQLVSELLARALSEETVVSELPPLQWPSQDLRPRIDLDDKDAVWRILDEGDTG